MVVLAAPIGDVAGAPRRRRRTTGCSAMSTTSIADAHVYDARGPVALGSEHLAPFSSRTTCRSAHRRRGKSTRCFHRPSIAFHASLSTTLPAFLPPSIGFDDRQTPNIKHLHLPSVAACSYIVHSPIVHTPRPAP